MPGSRPGITVPEGPRGAAMPSPKNELPGVLIYSVAITVGVLASFAVQIWLIRAGYDPVAVWQNLFSSKTLQLRTAGPWWAMAGTAFIAGGATAAALSRRPPPWHRHRNLRWVLGIVLVFGLAHVGHSAPSGGLSTQAGTQVAVSMITVVLAAILAMVGAFLTRR